MMFAMPGFYAENAYAQEPDPVDSVAPDVGKTKSARMNKRRDRRRAKNARPMKKARSPKSLSSDLSILDHDSPISPPIDEVNESSPHHATTSARLGRAAPQPTERIEAPSKRTVTGDHPARFQILLIEASQAQNSYIDPKLTPLQQDLISGFKGYNYFTLFQALQADITPNQPTSIRLPDRAQSILTLNVGAAKLDGQRRAVTMAINNTQPSQLMTAVGSTFFQAGLPTARGILIIAFTMQK